jgi:hypothetical protein
MGLARAVARIANKTEEVFGGFKQGLNPQEPDFIRWAGSVAKPHSILEHAGFAFDSPLRMPV